MRNNKRIGIYPGSFDPITFGHIDIIKRACKLVDKLIIGVAKNINKFATFELSLRINMVEAEIKRIGVVADVLTFDGMLIKFAREHGASIIIRGLRSILDFYYEFRMSWINYNLFSEIETIFLLPSEKTQFISSSFVKEMASLGESVSRFVPEYVQRELYNLQQQDNNNVIKTDCIEK